MPPSPTPQQRALRAVTRRHFFGDCGVSIGRAALASLLAREAAAASASPAGLGNPLAPKPGHYAARAKRVIFLFMAGAPSQADLFDYKPALEKLHGQAPPESLVRQLRLAFAQRNATLLGPQYKFQKCGQSGAEISDALPHLREVADEITIVRSMQANHFNHAPAQIFVNTGSGLPGRPSIGAWALYGLGSEADDLPGFVVLSSGGGTSGGTANFNSGFLPTLYSGVPFRSQGAPIVNVSNPRGVDTTLQRESIDLIRHVNEHRLGLVGDPEIASRISAYEMAFRMQTRAPELMDLSQETAATLAMYGAEPGKASFANQCLLARRLVERGVRFVNVYLKGWDHHSNVKGGLKTMCGKSDQAAAALIKDLRQRGLLDETLIIWGGEFGRTPIVEANATLGRTAGRDHHPHAYSMWLAGGGVKAGITLGQTDELGFNVVEDRVHVHDLQATIMHLLGIDHHRLTFTYQGRPYRLTDVHGNVVKKLLA
ncbi:MAG: DUF1501 domain-containing protein [Pirellulales bacterium]